MNQVNHLPVLENDAVSRLNLLAEIFFHRLLNAVDRYGCFDARPGMLRARLFPLKLDDVTNDNMAEWLNECIQAGLIKTYEVNGLPYLQVAGFKRKLGAYKTPYPAPPFVHEAQGTVTAEKAKPEPGKEHEYFYNELYKRENERHLSKLAVHIRQPEIKPAWIKAFNEQLRNEHRRYTIDNEWLDALKKWLPANVHRLIREEAPAKTGKRPAPMVL